jgi:toxin ParE1/3/4
MKRYEVILTEHALLDLDDIAHYIARLMRRKKPKACRAASREGVFVAGCSSQPNRPELLAMGNRFREVHCKPYRIIYRVLDRKVVLLIIADGRAICAHCPKADADCRL